MVVGAEKIVILAMLLLGMGAVVSFFIRDFKTKTFTGSAFSFAASALTVVAVFRVFGGESSDGIILSLPWLNSVSFRIHVDGISAIFLFLLAIVLPFIFQYSSTYFKMRQEIPNYYPTALLLALSVYGLLVVADTLIVLGFFWQVMAFCGWLLIKNGESKSRGSAARSFFVWMQTGFLFTMIGAIGAVMACDLGQTSYFELFDFNNLSERMDGAVAAEPLTVNFAISMFLIGFGIKLGIAPFGLFWLADSYDSAPSPISALFSAIVSKTGLYGLIRTFINLLPEGAIEHLNLQIWGIILGGLGMTTLAIATWKAFVEGEIKRILAYSTMATSGLIMAGLGICVSMVSISEKSSAVAAIAIIGVLVHFINHGIVNALLFLNAGIVLNFSTASSIGKISGLARYLPVSCICGLIASLSAAGLPPFNGFIGKWFIYVTSVKCAANIPIFAVIGGVAILAGITTVVIFIKYFGSIYLSKPADGSGDDVKFREADISEHDVNGYISQIGLCFLTVLFSLFPQAATGLVVKLMVKNPHGLGKVMVKGVHKYYEYDAGINWGFSNAPASVFTTMAFAYSVAVIVSKCGAAKRTPGESWLCGYQRHNKYTQYTPFHFCHDLVNKVRKTVQLGTYNKKENLELGSKYNLVEQHEQGCSDGQSEMKFDKNSSFENR